ncbi:sodium:solute symporter family transporter [Escherichia coli]
MLKGLNFVAIISLMGWGLGYFGQPHILARFMAADSHHSIVHARRISMTWMILYCLQGRWLLASLGLLTLRSSGVGWCGKSERRACVYRTGANSVNPWIAGFCCRQFWRR